MAGMVQREEQSRTSLLVTTLQNMLAAVAVELAHLRSTHDAAIADLSRRSCEVEDLEYEWDGLQARLLKLQGGQKRLEGVSGRVQDEID